MANWRVSLNNSRNSAGSTYTAFGGGVSVGIPPSSTIGDNGALMLGTSVGGGTMTLSSANAGAGLTATASAAAFTNTSADVGKVITINDSGTYKTATITAAVSTTQATVTLTTALSSAGPWASTAWTLCVPFPVITRSMGMFLYYPANAIVAGSSAGAYWTQMLAAGGDAIACGTVGTIYNNTYTNGVPASVSSPTAFSTTGPGGFTQTTAADITLGSYTIAGGSIGINGFIEVSTDWMFPTLATAGNKTVKVLYGAGVAFGFYTITTSLAIRAFTLIRNWGSVTLQMASLQGFYQGYSATTVASASNSINTATQQTLLITGQLATSTDYIILGPCFIKVTP